MPVPKRKKSKSKKLMRQRSHKRPITTAQKCENCGEARETHRVCPACGYYKGRQVLTVEAKE